MFFGGGQNGWFWVVFSRSLIRRDTCVQRLKGDFLTRIKDGQRGGLSTLGTKLSLSITQTGGRTRPHIHVSVPSAAACAQTRHLAVPHPGCGRSQKQKRRAQAGARQRGGGTGVDEATNLAKKGGGPCRRRSRDTPQARARGRKLSIQKNDGVSKKKRGGATGWCDVWGWFSGDKKKNAST